MRFLKFAIAVTAAIICLSNCSKISEGGDDGNAITFTATVENITRTSLSENNGILWSAQDSIDVFTSDGQRYCFKEVTVSQDRKEAEFSGKIPVSSGYCALYPAGTIPTKMTRTSNVPRHQNSSCSASELQCAAFILGHYHNKGHNPSTKDLYTVEKLEELTGLTFFVNVPNAPKSTFTASDWGL